MKKTKILFSTLFVAAFLLFSCEGEEDSSSVSGNCDNLESLALTLSQKADAFSANPSSSTCSAMKTAAFNMINVAKNCDGVTAEQYEAAAQAWVNVDCSGFD